ncbi:MAG: anti-sigma-D factor RsdA [Mycobacterium sp.]
MPDFGRGSGADFGRARDPESLDDIARSDQLLDALAGGQQRVRAGDAGEAELLALLEGWRDGVRRPPAGDLINEREAAAAIQRGVAARPSVHKGTRRHLAAVGSIAAAVLCIGGFGAVVAGAGPGDSLYGVRTALFGEPQSVRDDRVALAAQTEMAEVQRLIDQGDWEQAQQKLETVTTAVADVGDATRQQELVNEWYELNKKVETRDPAATLPPPAPGEPALTLPLPVVEATTPTTPSSEETTPPSETTTPPGETSGETPSPTTEPGSTTEPSPTAEPSPTTEPGSTTEPSPVTEPTSSVPTTTTSAAPTTTTSAAPTTTAPTTTAPTVTTTTTTTVLPAPAAEAPAAEPSVPSSTMVEAETETVSTPAQAPTSVRQAPSVTAPTTTTVVPDGPVELPIPEVN